jgi:hypothetical protein
VTTGFKVFLQRAEAGLIFLASFALAASSNATWTTISFGVKCFSVWNSVSSAMRGAAAMRAQSSSSAAELETSSTFTASP